MFSCGMWYILIIEVIIPVICGLKKWKKYVFPGTYMTITNKKAEEILGTEKFINRIPVLEERKEKQDFLESDNYFWFNGQLVPKNEIQEFEFDYHKKGVNKFHFNILLKNGFLIKEICYEVADSSSKYKDNPVTDYLIDYLLKSGYEKIDYFKYRYKKGV